MQVCWRPGGCLIPWRKVLLERRVAPRRLLLRLRCAPRTLREVWLEGRVASRRPLPLAARRLLSPRRLAQVFAGGARSCCVSRMRARAASCLELPNPCARFCWRGASLRAACCRWRPGGCTVPRRLAQGFAERARSCWLGWRSALAASLFGSQTIALGFVGGARRFTQAVAARRFGLVGLGCRRRPGDRKAGLVR